MAAIWKDNMQSHPVADRESNSTNEYALGYTANEHDRLIRQASRIAPVTERLFREAGTSPGQRVLDLGSGVGDVSMLPARIVGPTGEVVGIERDASSIARSRDQVAAAGLRNVDFTESDVNQIVSDQLFDAAAGRFILMFLADPASVLRSVSRLVRPGGVVVFQEPTWIPFLAFNARLPLWSELLSAIHETFLRSGVNPEMGPALYRLYQEVGLPARNVRMEMLLGSDTDFISLVCDLLGSVRALAEHHNVSLEALGDLRTVTSRAHAEIAASNGVVSFVPMVGVWSRKPNGE